jgi:hypothetical protein
VLLVPSTAIDYVTANSYLSIEEADEIILAQQGSNAAWDCLDDPTKSIILIQSTLAVDGAFAYKGKKTDPVQLLRFPRSGSVTVPVNLKFAEALVAMDFSNEKAFDGVKSEKISKMSWVFDKSKEGVTQKVLAFLRPFRTKTVQINR